MIKICKCYYCIVNTKPSVTVACGVFLKLFHLICTERGSSIHRNEVVMMNNMSIFGVWHNQDED